MGKVEVKLEEFKVDELKELAKKDGINFPSKIKKADLISLIEANISGNGNGQPTATDPSASAEESGDTDASATDMSGEAVSTTDPAVDELEKRIARAKEKIPAEKLGIYEVADEIFRNLVIANKGKKLNVWPDGMGYRHQTIDGGERWIHRDTFQTRLERINDVHNLGIKEENKPGSPLSVWSEKVEDQLIQLLENLTKWPKELYDDRDSQVAWLGALRAVIDKLIWEKIPSIYLVDWDKFRPVTKNAVVKAEADIQSLQIASLGKLGDRDWFLAELDKIRMKYGLSEDQLEEILRAKPKKRGDKNGGEGK